MDANNLLKQSETWYIIDRNYQKGPFSYLEIAKQLDLSEISFDTLVTRRKDDKEGFPIGKISDFAENTVSDFIAKISPPHTTLHSSRSFIRIGIEEEAFLKLPFGNRVPVKIKSISAGGCKVESTTRLEGISPHDVIQFIIPNLGEIYPEPLKIKTHVINQRMSGFHNIHKFESLLSFQRLSFDEKGKLLEGILHKTFDGLPPVTSTGKRRRLTDIILDKIKNL